MKMKTGRVKIAGSRLSAHGSLLPMKGQDLRISLVDEDGEETTLPAMSLSLECKGRQRQVEATVVLWVSEMDVEIDDAKLVNGVRCGGCKDWVEPDAGMLCIGCRRHR